MSKRYLFFTTLSYAYSIFRPLQAEILARGDQVAWYLVQDVPNLLVHDEELLMTIEEVIEYNPTAVFACGNMVYHFFPGIKVALFHGYPIQKRGEKEAGRDNHFAIRGWFDIYCTQGPSSTEHFKKLEVQHGFFKVYETGWAKVDPYFLPYTVNNTSPTVLYATTFTKGISSAPILVTTIARLVKDKGWNWILTFHPKIDDDELLAKYRKLAEENDNVRYADTVTLNDFQQADVMLCDSSSIILEFMLMDKPVVTFRNTNPGPHLIDVHDVTEIGSAIEVALQRPKVLMDTVQEFTQFHEAYRDGHNCQRILAAVDDFESNQIHKMKLKPVNWWRKFKLRKQLNYWKPCTR